MAAMEPNNDEYLRYSSNRRNKSTVRKFIATGLSEGCKKRLDSYLLEKSEYAIYRNSEENTIIGYLYSCKLQSTRGINMYIGESTSIPLEECSENILLIRSEWNKDCYDITEIGDYRKVPIPGQGRRRNKRNYAPKKNHSILEYYSNASLQEEEDSDSDTVDENDDHWVIECN